MTNDIEIQTVWRHISELGYAGYLVWDVVEVIGETKPQSYLTPTIDDRYVLVQCYHFFTREKMTDFVTEKDEYAKTYQDIVIV
jgi:hypothetical protein